MSATTARVLGPVTSGVHTFTAREEQWAFPACEEAPVRSTSYALDVPLQQAWQWGSGVAVLRQGLVAEGPWGVDADLRTDRGAVTPAEARLFAHALLAAADVAVQLEHTEHEVPC